MSLHTIAISLFAHVFDGENKVPKWHYILECLIMHKHVLKETAAEIASIITHVFQQSYNTFKTSR